MHEQYLPVLKPAPKPALDDVRKKFEHWRKTRKRRRPIPKELWDDAVALSKRHSINTIAKVLCLNYTTLKSRIHGIQSKKKPPPPDPAFVELDFGVSTSECIVEMEKKGGAKMRMRFRGSTDFDPLTLSKAFWNSRT
jgi:hypothetical protein